MSVNAMSITSDATLVKRAVTESSAPQTKYRVGTPGSLQVIKPNALTPVIVENEFCSAEVFVKVLDADNPSPYFTDRKRRFAIQMHITLKEDMSGNDLMWSAYFDRPLRLPMITGVFTSFWNMIDPSSELSLTSNTPYIRTYMLSAMDVISTLYNASQPEQTESTASLLPHATLTTKQRQKWALTSTNRESVMFRKGRGYFFETFTPFLDAKGFKAKLPGFNIDLMRTLNGQPMRFGVQNRNASRTLFVVEIDHSV